MSWHASVKEGFGQKFPTIVVLDEEKNCSFLRSGDNVVKPRVVVECHCQIYQVRNSVSLKMLEMYQISIVIPLLMFFDQEDTT